MQLILCLVAILVCSVYIGYFLSVSILWHCVYMLCVLYNDVHPLVQVTKVSVLFCSMFIKECKLIETLLSSLLILSNAPDTLLRYCSWRSIMEEITPFAAVVIQRFLVLLIIHTHPNSHTYFIYAIKHGYICFIS